MRKIIYILPGLVFFAKTLFAGVFVDSTTVVIDEIVNVKKGDAAWGDYDCDGDWDLIITGLSGEGIPETVLYKNTGGSLEKDKSVSLPSLGYSSLAFGDYNNDGAIDLFICGDDEDGAKQAYIYENSGSGVLTDTGIELGPLIGGENASRSRYGDAAWGDFNNDGKMDLALIGESAVGARLNNYVYVNQGDENFTSVDLSAVSGGAGFRNGSLAWGDYNNDGYLDLIVMGNTNKDDDYDNLMLLYKYVPATDSFAVVSSPASGSSLPGVRNGELVLNDLNNDRYLDLIVCGRDDTDTCFQVWENLGPSSEYKLSKSTDMIGSNEGVIYSALAAADVDNNGCADIVVSGRFTTDGNKYTKLYLNSGNFNFSENDESGAFDSAKVEDSSLAFGDGDSDGNPDLILIGAKGSAAGDVKTLFFKNTTGEKPRPKAVETETMISYYIDGKLYIMWNDPSGEANPDSYYYNFRVGTSEGADDLVPARYGTPLLGNYLTKATTDTFSDSNKSNIPGLSNYKHIRVLNISGPNYHWAVQSIDPALGYTWAVAGSSTTGWSENQVFIDTTPPTGLASTPVDEGKYTYEDDIIFTWDKGTAADPETGIYGCFVQVKEEDPSGVANIVISTEISKRFTETVWDSDGSARYEYKGSIDNTYYIRVKARHGYTMNRPTSTYVTSEGSDSVAWLWDHRSLHYTSAGLNDGWTAWSDGIKIVELLSVNNNLLRTPGSEYAEISYALVDDGDVRIRIFNILGELVKTVLDEYIEVGSEEIARWYGVTDDGDPVASGVYYVNIQACGEQDTEKIVVVK